MGAQIRQPEFTPEERAARKNKIIQAHADTCVLLRRDGISQSESLYVICTSIVEYLRKYSGQRAAMQLVSECERAALRQPISPWEEVMPR